MESLIELAKIELARLRAETDERWRGLVNRLRARLASAGYFKRIQEGEDCPEMWDLLHGDDLDEATQEASAHFLYYIQPRPFRPSPDIREAFNRAALRAGKRIGWLRTLAPEDLDTFRAQAQDQAEPEETAAEREDRRNRNNEIIAEWVCAVYATDWRAEDRVRDIIADWIITAYDSLDAQPGFSRQATWNL